MQSCITIFITLWNYSDFHHGWKATWTLSLHSSGAAPFLWQISYLHLNKNLQSSTPAIISQPSRYPFDLLHPTPTFRHLQDQNQSNLSLSLSALLPYVQRGVSYASKVWNAICWKLLCSFKFYILPFLVGLTCA